MDNLLYSLYLPWHNNINNSGELLMSVEIKRISLYRLAEWAKFVRHTNSTEKVDVHMGTFDTQYNSDELTMIIGRCNNIHLVNKVGDTFALKHTEFAYINIQ